MYNIGSLMYNIGEYFESKTFDSLVGRTFDDKNI